MPISMKKVWNINFNKNGEEKTGAMQKAINECGNDEIIIWVNHRTYGNMWGNLSPKQLLKLIENNKGIYEVITKFPHKVYFDVDKKKKDDEEISIDYLLNVKNTILQFFPDANMAISGSITENKVSYHIVLSNYLITNEEERQRMKTLVKYISKELDDGFDWKVYTKNRNMKCINQKKINDDDSRIQRIIENEDYREHCITCFFTNQTIHKIPLVDELPENLKEEIVVQREKQGKSYDLSVLPKMTLSLPDDNFNAFDASPYQLLQLLPLSKEGFDHSYTHLVARFCYYNELTFDIFIEWLKNKHENMQKNDSIYNKWELHWKRLFRFPPVHIPRIIKLLSYWFPDINKDKAFRLFQKSFNLPNENIHKIERLEDEHFQVDEKYLLFNIGMGGGKTERTVRYLKENFLWIAPNRALGLNTQRRIEQLIPVSHYADFSGISKKFGKLMECDNLIVCLNSLHYLGDKRYDVIVIDEIETVLDKFMGDFLEGTDKEQPKKKIIWDTFVDMIRQAKKVILLDAFITTKTTNFLKNIDTDAMKQMKIYERLDEPTTRECHIIHEVTALNEIIEHIKNKKKLFIFYPYKRSNCNIFDMRQMHDRIVKETGQNGIFYNADVDEPIKKGLNDVNKSWGDVSFIITNNVITCGINYDKLDFDYKYIFVASHNSPRDIIQVSYRARHLNSKIIKIAYMGKMCQNYTWINDKDRIQCPIYSGLYDDIINEKNAPIRKSLQLFISKAHYKYKLNVLKIADGVKEELYTLFGEYGISISYQCIKNINVEQVETIEKKIFEQTATMTEKFELQKYYFKKSLSDDLFAKNTYDENDTCITDDAVLFGRWCVRVIWNENYISAFKKLVFAYNDENNLFNKIRKEIPSKHFENDGIANKDFYEQDFFPTNLNFKLSSSLLDEIFRNFTFRHVSKKSATQKIIKEIYNAYFGKVIYSSKTDENKNCQYNIEYNNVLNDMCYLAKRFMKKEEKTMLTYDEETDDLKIIIEI